MPKEDAFINMRYILSDETLDVPEHLKGHLERFLELMINERAPMDELVYEYGKALNALLHYDLLKPDTPEKPIKESDISLSGQPGPKEDGPEKEDAGKETLSDIAEGVVKDLMERGLAFHEAFSVIRMARGILKSSKTICVRELDTIPLKELKRMREGRNA